MSGAGLEPVTRRVVRGVTTSAEETQVNHLAAAAYERVLTAYAAVGDLIARKTDLDQILIAITRQARSLLEVRRCSLYLTEGDAGRFRGAVAVIDGGREDPAIRRLVCGGASDGFTREILETRRPVLIKDAVRDPRPVRAAVRNWGVRSILGVPLIVQDEVIGLLFLDDKDDHHHFSPGDARLVTMFAGLAAPALVQAQRMHTLTTRAVNAVRQNEMLRRTNALEERLTALALDAANVEQVVQAVARIVAEPCILHDHDHRRAATVLCDDAPLVSVLDHTVPASVRRMVLESVASGKPAIVGPFPDTALHRRFLVAPVRGTHEVFGHLVIGERSRRLGALDLGLARHAAGILALGFASGDRADRVGAYARQALLRDLLAGTADRAAVGDRAEQCGVDLERPHSVALLRRQCGGPLSCEPVERAVRAIGSPLPGFVVAGEPGTVTLVLPASGEGAAAEARAVVARLLDHLAADGVEIVAALSAACDIVAEAPAAIAEAAEVMRCLVEVGGPAGTALLSADELGAGRLILAALNRAEARRFVKQTLGPLLDSAVRGGDLLATLGVFFDCCRSVRQAALTMDVHENTIRYRLARVAEVTGLDLASNPDDQLCGQLAVLILRLQGELPHAVAQEAPGEAEDLLLIA